MGIRMRKRNWTRVISVMLLMIVIFTTAIFAGNGDGTGGGEGTEPVSLASSSPANGATGVSVDTSIRLNFTKNVVNLSVAENNKGCIRLTDGSGKNVGIQVIMGDDQIDTTVKKIIDIKPNSSLQDGTKYTLTVSGDLMGKNGYTMGNSASVTFTTQGTSKVVNSTVKPSEVGADELTSGAVGQVKATIAKEDSSKDKATGGSLEVEKEKTKEIKKEKASNELAVTVGIVVGVIFVGGIVFGILRRKKKKK